MHDKKHSIRPIRELKLKMTVAWNFLFIYNYFIMKVLVEATATYIDYDVRTM